MKSSSWQFAQSFGTEETEDSGLCEDDIFTAVDFHPQGDLIALGDKAGRITLFDVLPETVCCRLLYCLFLASSIVMFIYF